jgi:putative glutamine transport system substrate-binding protein
MSRQFSSLVWSVAGGTALAALALALAGCGEEPVPPRLIGLSPAVLTVPGNDDLAISVEYEENDFALQNFRWTADAGEIEGNGAPSITYHAPADPGDYKIAVSVTYGDDQAALSLDAIVKVTAAVGAPAPAVSKAAPAGSDRPAETAATAGAADEEAAPATEQTAEPTATAEAARETDEGTAATTQAKGPAAGAAADGTKEAVETVEESAESDAAAAGRAVEEAADATERASEEGAAAVAEGTGRATASVEETATAIRDAVEDTAAATGQAVEGAEREVAAAAEEAAPDKREAAAAAGRAVPDRPGSGAAPAQASGGQTGDQPGKRQAEPQVAALTEQGVGTRSGSSRIDHILDRHRLTAVVQIAFDPFSFYGEDGRRTGFEVDLVREFARRWLDDPKAVTFLPVPTDARIPTLKKGRAEIVAAALTKTPERAEEVDFSLTYFKDGQRLLVQEGSAIAGVCDLRGKKVAAIHGSTSLDNIVAEAKKCGFEPGDDLVTFRRHGDAVEALLAGEVEVFTSDGIALESFAKGRPLEVVGNHFSEEPYGVAVSKGDERLLQLVNRTLEQMDQDGTYAALYAKWFGEAIRPYPLEEAANAPADTEVAALATSSAPTILEPRTGRPGAVEEYVVQAGDTLSRIAGKVYGDVGPRSWRRIYEANKAAIGDDPSRIRVGMSLTIPQ